MSLSAIVQEHVTLRRAGRTMKGLCPFHGEKTPSFHVDEQKGFFHCFGCQAGGDVYKFLMMKEALSFPEAVRRLAGRAGIPVPETRERGPQDELRDRILEINGQTQAIHAEALRSPEGAEARSYLGDRGLTECVVESFGLGWAPDSWDFLAGRLAGRFSERDLSVAGVVTPRPGGSGVYDRFRKRVTFPIRAVSERVVAFGGRILGEGEPKYLNSPETPVYQKGQYLYGLDRARGAIRQKGEVILVEGYLDAIALHAHGIENVVAVLGTALTAAQAALLSRHAERVVLNFDGDPAGRRAARRSVEVLLEQGLTDLRVLELPPGEDPDDHVRRAGGESYLRSVEAATTFFDFLVRIASSEQDLGAPTGRVRALESLLPYLLRFEDRVLRSEYSDAAADALHLPRALVQDEVRRKMRRRPSRDDEATSRPLLTATRAERTLAAWLVADQQVRDLVRSMVDEACLAELARPELFRGLLAEPATSFDFARVLDRIEDEEQRSLLSRCAVDQELEPVLRDGLEDRVRALVEELGLSPRRRAARLKAEVDRKLAEAIARGDQTAVAVLSIESQQIARKMHA